MTDVTITRTDSHVSVESPYSEAFVAAARQRGGRWDRAAKAWTFDARDEAAVRELCREHYGTDGTADVARVDVRLTALRHVTAERDSVRLGNRTIARATGRDSGARLGDGVVIETGDLADYGIKRGSDGTISSGGSVQYWETIVGEGTVLLVRDLSEHDLGEVNERDWRVETVEASPIDADALREERERLVARLAEIDAALDA